MAENTTTIQQEEQVFDIGAFFDKYKRYWWLFVLSLIAFLCLAYYYMKVTNRVYDVNAVVLVAQEDNSSSAGANLLKSMKLMNGGGKVEDEMIVFSSQELCTEVAKQLKLNMHAAEKKMLKREQALPVILYPPDMMGPILFLLSRASKAVTGQNLLGEGGKVMT